MKWRWRQHRRLKLEAHKNNPQNILAPGEWQLFQLSLENQAGVQFLWPQHIGKLNLWWTHGTMCQCIDAFVSANLRVGTNATLASRFTLSEGHFTHEPRAVTMQLWESTRKWPEAVPTHLRNHVVWSRALKCSVKPYVTRPSTKCYFNEFLFIWVLTYDKIE